MVDFLTFFENFRAARHEPGCGLELKVTSHDRGVDFETKSHLSPLHPRETDVTRRSDHSKIDINCCRSAGLPETEHSSTAAPHNLFNHKQLAISDMTLFSKVAICLFLYIFASFLDPPGPTTRLLLTGLLYAVPISMLYLLHVYTGPR